MKNSRFKGVLDDFTFIESDIKYETQITVQVGEFSFEVPVTFWQADMTDIYQTWIAKCDYSAAQGSTHISALAALRKTLLIEISIAMEERKEKYEKV